MQVAATLDALKAAGFHWATRAGITIAIDDVVTPPAKQEILDRYEKDAEKIEKQYQRGVITDEERRQELIEIWTKATSEVAREMEANFPRDQPGLDHGQLRCPRQHDADAPDRRHARPGGQPQGRDHPAADQGQLPRGPVRPGVLHRHPRRPQGPRGHGAADRRLRLPDPPAGRRLPGRDHPRGGLRHRARRDHAGRDHAAGRQPGQGDPRRDRRVRAGARRGRRSTRPATWSWRGARTSATC